MKFGWQFGVGAFLFGGQAIWVPRSTCEPLFVSPTGTQIPGHDDEIAALRDLGASRRVGLALPPESGAQIFSVARA